MVRWVTKLVVTLVVAALGLTALPVLASGVASELELGAPLRMAPVPDVSLGPLAQRSTILAADGSPIAVLYEEDRAPAQLSEIPDVIVQAVLAIEDDAFYEHQGFSLRGALRALGRNAATGGVAEGGSTITQQVIKNTVLDDDRTLTRKVREAMLAVRLENQIGKDGVLERYLNTVYFGEGAYGVRAAAERFFGKQLREIELAEAALLAGLIASPSTFDPFRDPERAEARRAAVLQRMVEEGAITTAAAEDAADTPLPEAPHDVLPDPNTYFVAEVKKQLLADPRLGATPQDRFNTLFRGGVRVETTFQPLAQLVATRAVAETLPDSPFTQALVAMNPANGAVEALVGGAGFNEQKFNVATQGGRQPGSTFKALALAAWLDAGRSPEDVVDGSAPCRFELPNGQVWEVDNYGDSSVRTFLTVREAAMRSSNCAFARIALELGPERLVEMARRLGIRSQLPAVPSLVLGAGEVTPLDMAVVAATFANDGVRHDPIYVRRVVTPDGKVLLENQPVAHRAVDPEVARTVNDVLRGVITAGTGRAADIGRPAAGKTGTTQNWTDAWFAGWTPNYVAIVWMGSPQGKVSMRGVGGRNVTGGSFPAMTWQRFMSAYLGPRPASDFPPPDRSLWPVPTVPEAARPPEAPTAQAPDQPASPTATAPPERSDDDRRGRGRKKP